MSKMSKISIFIRDKKKPVLYMFVGLPASGKSYYTRKLAKKTGASIHSSDDIRKELYGDERIQGDGNTVFNTLHSRIKEDLREGKSTIYDACNISYKKRMAFLQELNNIPCKKVYIFVATPLVKCLENNAIRERYVPVEVIRNMLKHFDTPSYFEGWNEIKICYPKRAYRSLYGTPNAFVEAYESYSQDNPHHDYSLGTHCKSTGYRFTRKDILYTAGLIHDCGKPFCKTYKNNKGERTEIAHYYSHENVGAYNSFFFNTKYSEEEQREVSELIRWHMTPYYWEKKGNEKMRNKYFNLWGEKLYEKVMLLHSADKEAH